MSAMKAKHQRLVLVVLALVAIVGAGLLATYALRNQASYFYLPEQMLADRPKWGRRCVWAGWSSRVRSRPMPTA